MAWDIGFAIIGALIAAAALRDVFDTVAVPGGSRARLKIVRRLVRLSLPLWKRWRGGGKGVPIAFAPTALVLSFAVWMLLLALGFGLVAYALRRSFQPPLHSLPDAIYLVGAAMTTIGRGDTTALGFARWIVLAAGFCGLAVVTLAITYLLEVQSGIGRRDTGIIKLSASAGDPPSAVRMLEWFASVGDQGQLPGVLREARNWCATVRQSHTNRPSLIYFQSVAATNGWPATLGTLIDLSLLFQLAIEDSNARGAAILLGEEATRLAGDLAGIVGLTPMRGETTVEDAQVAFARLTTAGYQLAPHIDAERFCAARATAQACVAAMADHLGKPTTILVAR